MKDTTGLYRGADKSLARPTFRCILFDANLVIYIKSTNITPIMIISKVKVSRDRPRWPKGFRVG